MSNLLGQTVALLKAVRANGVPLSTIADGAGKPVEYDWLKRFASGDIPDPSVNRVQHLHDHLITIAPRRKGAA
jgi:hypothetical protein